MRFDRIRIRLVLRLEPGGEAPKLAGEVEQLGDLGQAGEMMGLMLFVSVPGFASHLKPELAFGRRAFHGATGGGMKRFFVMASLGPTGDDVGFGHAIDFGDGLLPGAGFLFGALPFALGMLDDADIEQVRGEAIELAAGTIGAAQREQGMGQIVRWRRAGGAVQHASGVAGERAVEGAHGLKS
jgi:hypothetical protein